MDKLDQMYIPAGATIYVDGVPVTVCNGVYVFGLKENFNIDGGERGEALTIMSGK